MKEEHNLQPVSRRLFEILDPVITITRINEMIKAFKQTGWEIKRGIAGIVILTLQDGEIHYIPTLKGIEEVIYERKK